MVYSTQVGIPHHSLPQNHSLPHNHSLPRILYHTILFRIFLPSAPSPTCIPFYSPHPSILSVPLPRPSESACLGWPAAARANCLVLANSPPALTVVYFGRLAARRLSRQATPKGCGTASAVRERATTDIAPPLPLAPLPSHGAQPPGERPALACTSVACPAATRLARSGQLSARVKGAEEGVANR